MLSSLTAVIGLVFVVHKRPGNSSPREPVLPSTNKETASVDGNEEKYSHITKVVAHIVLVSFLVVLLLSAAAFSISRSFDVSPFSSKGSASPSGPDLVGLYGSIPSPMWSSVQLKLSPVAEALFSQGVAQLYNFNQLEARRNFLASVSIDSRCVMCHWGVAHSFGSTVNAAMSEVECRLGLRAIREVSLDESNVLLLTRLQQLLIEAQYQRYKCCSESVRIWTSRADVIACEESYAAAMTKVRNEYAQDPTVLALYADALLNLTPWDYYTDNGTFKVLVPLAQQALEAVTAALLLDCNNLLALHLAIHIYEAGNNPAEGEAAADTLLKLAAPTKLGHLLHMPSHICARIGRQADSIEVNQRAIEANEFYRSISLVPYVPEHNKAMLVASALDVGNMELSLQYSKPSLQSDFKSGVSLTSSFPAQTELIFCRFGRWHDILSLQKEEGGLVRSVQGIPLFLRAISDYAGALAYLHSGKTIGALSLRTELGEIAKNMSTNLRLLEFPKGHAFYNNHLEMVQLMTIIFDAAISIKKREFSDAVAKLKSAVNIQDGFHYTEPEHFYLPIRQCLGGALLLAYNDKKKRGGEVLGKLLHGAEDVYREDLHHHPNSSWSIRGIKIVLDSYENKTEFEDSHKTENKLLRSHSDVHAIRGTCCEIGHC